ncbi:flagellar hook-associated protein FlgK [Halomonas sp. MCCC 1A17488]|uniref:Flagellar hook-associated protein 1 n=1 Tax=Billgrantia sulfidoxydans TaxID=2733484 RepID=A0ABX7W5H6_9GAMM|nr:MULTISPECIES: flagellar hook-associated protein FlgK [Halomonas]MCE8014786.1 flagellar hook-associated protein FlgK [Halomonas sp. MCCC 1A17488]MCG3238119.1 flagellar hook-associated protein FlgK [Halomonas sp. MCCC 1A17488]QPP48111.1 flagellar hook-associated protein FlgK [Halomonas sp. SS10-MC5]QTP55400.1 flagellar hook-associated protein FlgK [Halomonas sulfidoxydans]
MSTIFSVGLSGLNAAQNALNTTSNNISNVYTPGYNRELTILGQSRADAGVQVNDIQRQFNQYVASQLNAATSSSSALSTYENQISQIDNLLADREAGLAPLMQSFFSSLEDLAGAPSDPAARQGVLGTADTMTAQFRAFDGYLQDMQEGINGQIEDEVTQINNATEQLATLNREIALARARSGEAPNSLLNQRDQLVAELSERMNLRLDIQDGKSYNISLPNGQPLVSGTNHYRLEAMDAPNDPQRTVLGYRDSGGNLIALPENTIQGGALGGLMTFRAETLDKTQSQIGQLAVSLTVGFNEQHRQGMDLNGDPGGDFFTIGQPQAYSYPRNTSGEDVLTASFDTDNIDRLRATDYTVRFGTPGDPPQVIRKDNGQAVPADEITWDDGTSTLGFGGVTLQFSGTPANGDRYEVQPVRRAAAAFESQVSDLDKIAAAQPLNPTDDPADWIMSGTGDNRNALALQNLQSEALVAGRSSFSQAYAGMVSDVGNRANIVKVNLDARQGLTDQLKAVQQSESGVNLDEEAANLIRYQQFYMANARVIDTASTVFDTILGLRN